MWITSQPFPHGVSSSQGELRGRSWLPWGVQRFGWEPSPRNRELMTQGKGRGEESGSEGRAWRRPCPCSPLSQLSVSAGSQGQDGCSQRGMVTTDLCWMCCGSLRACLAVLSFLKMSLRPWGGHQCFGMFFLFWAFPIIYIFFCFRCQGRERSISILVTGAPGVFQAVCHDLLHGCRRKCPVREGSFCTADYRGGSFPCWSSGAAPWWGWNLYQKSP